MTHYHFLVIDETNRKFGINYLKRMFGAKHGVRVSDKSSQAIKWMPQQLDRNFYKRFAYLERISTPVPFHNLGLFVFSDDAMSTSGLIVLQSQGVYARVFKVRVNLLAAITACIEVYFEMTSHYMQCMAAMVESSFRLKHDVPIWFNKPRHLQAMQKTSNQLKEWIDVVGDDYSATLKKFNRITNNTW